MTKGSPDGNIEVGSPAEAQGRSPGPADNQSKSGVPAGATRVRRAGAAKPGRRGGDAGAARQSRTAAAVSKARGKVVTALVRTGLGPHKQPVYTMTTIPAAAIDPNQKDNWLTDGEQFDESWTHQERMTFAGMATFLIFFGFLIGKAF